MTTFFQAHLGDEEGVCSDHRNLKTTQPPHQQPGTSGWWKPQKIAFLSFGFVSYRVCVVCFICVCIWGCLFVWTVSFGGSWLLSSFLCEVADKKPSVCFSPSGRLPGLRCRLAFCWPGAQSTFQWAPGKWGKEDFRAGSKAGVYQPVKQSHGEKQVSVIEMSIECKNTMAEENRRGGRGLHTRSDRQCALFNTRNTWSFGREQGVLVDICERTKGGIELPRELDIIPRCGLEVRPSPKPEINLNTPPSEEVELFLNMQAFALKLFPKPKI